MESFECEIENCLGHVEVSPLKICAVLNDRQYIDFRNVLWVEETRRKSRVFAKSQLLFGVKIAYAVYDEKVLRVDYLRTWHVDQKAAAVFAAFVDRFLAPYDRTTPIGRLIDDYLRSSTDLDDHVIHLLFSANRWELSSRITELLDSGVSVVVDRYAFSGVAFTHAKGLPFAWCKSPDVSLPKPDAVFFMNLHTDELKRRLSIIDGNTPPERYEKLDFQLTVKDAFGRMRDGSWRVFDGARPLDDLHESITRATEEILKSPSLDSPVQKLWMSPPLSPITNRSPQTTATDA